MKKIIIIITLMFSFMYGSTEGVTGNTASTKNSNDAGSETPPMDIQIKKQEKHINQ